MNNELLERHAQRLRESIAECAEEAGLVINDYWGFFKIQNKKIAQAQGRGETERKVAKLAPVIEDVGTGAKPRIRWRLFDGASRRITKAMNSQRSASKAVRPRTRGYTNEQLKSYCVGWETDEVLATEEQLRPLRKTIDHLNDALRGIERTMRYNQSNGE